MILSEMKVVLTAVTSAFARHMDKASDRIKNFRRGAGKMGLSLGNVRSALGKVGGALKSMAGLALKAGAALAGIAWGAKKVFDLGASIEETGSKFNTVFGPEASAEVSAFLDNFAAKAGLTTHEAKGLVATTGAIAQGLGFAQKASGAMAIEITKLAADLASFNEVPTSETLHAITSALTGEREQLKQLGIVVLQEDVNFQAFANTSKTVAKNLTAQEKATATLQIITERAGVAVGDLDRTQGSAANVAKRLGASFKEIGEAIATALMPAFKKILESLEKNEQKFIDFKAKILENSGIISAWAMVFVEAVKFVGMFILGIITNIQNMGEMFVNVMDMVKNVGRLDWAAVKDEWNQIKANREAMKKTDEDLEAQFAKMGEAIKTAFGGGLVVARDFQKQLENLPPLIDPDDDDNPIDPLIASVKTLEDRLRDLSESFSKNFVNRMTTAAQGGKDAFTGYFEYMRKQLIALAMRALLFKAIMGVATKVNLDLGGFATAMTGFSPATSGDSGNTGAGAPGAGTPILSGHAARASGGGQIVNQNINFSVNAIDGRSAARFIKEQGGTIAEVIATAAKDSTAYRRQLQGA
jgi:hypothetical protein